jgi:hypothetical protein
MADYSDDIQQLIREEPDSRTRALLLILERIDDSLRANTRQTHEIGTKLDAHLTRYEEQARADASLRSQAQGVWRVLTYVLAFAQAVLIAGGTWLYGEISKLHGIDADVQQRLGLVESTVRFLEKASAPR